MKDELAKKINVISQDKSLRDEASIKTGVILPILSLLGWDPFNIEEVKPEYTVKTRKVDFSLRVKEVNKVFIEVKRSSENLDDHQEQLLGYSFREGVKLAILTNGLTWWFYLPLNEGNWESRRFYAADLQEQEPQAIAEVFLNLLSKENVISGDSLKNAEDIYRSQKKNEIINKSLPKAWHKIISDPDDLLVDLMIETTEKISGFRPEINEVTKFLKNISYSTSLNSNSLTKEKSGTGSFNTDNMTNKKNEVQSNFSGKTNLNNSFEVTLPPAFIIWGGFSCKNVRDYFPNEKKNFTIKFHGVGEVRAWMSKNRIKIHSPNFREIISKLDLKEYSKLTFKIIKPYEYYEASKKSKD